MSLLRRGTRAALAAALALGLPGCGVPLLGPGDVLVNTCTSSDECGADGVCVSDRCVSTKASLSGLLLQIDLPSSSLWGAGTSTLLDPAKDGLVLQGRSDAGFVVGHDLLVPELVSISDVRLQISQPPVGCSAATDGSMPLTVQVQPAEQPVGLPLAQYSAKSALLHDGTDTRYSACLEVPAGQYDVYLQIDRDPSNPDDPNQNCRLPPVLLAAQNISGSSVAVNVTAGPDSAPVELTGFVTGLSSNLSLEGWTIDLVENAGGRAISTSQSFGKRALGSGSTTHWGGSGQGGSGGVPVPAAPFALTYWPKFAGQPLIRLTPPTDAVAMPTVLWLLSAVDLDGDNHVGLDLSALAAATPVKIDGAVLDESSGGVGARVTIQSVELLGGEFGGNVAYRTTADAGSSGHFEVSLLPGTYKVIAVPGGAPSEAITEASWKINQNDLGGGKTVVLNPKGSLIGTVLTPAGNAAFRVPSNLQPSASPALAYLDEILSTYDLLPTTATALTDDSGAFSIPVDPGVFDLSLRPEDSSGFPWLVRAQITVQARTEPAAPPDDLGTLSLSCPVLLGGQIRAGDGSLLPGAVIRAWLPVPADPGDSGQSRPTVIQIARALSDANGSYALYLPASISQ
jgi:hypothetical protein